MDNGMGAADGGRMLGGMTRRAAQAMRLRQMQIEAQLAQAMGQPQQQAPAMPAPPMGQPGMSQSQFSGYGAGPRAPYPAQQRRLAELLRLQANQVPQ